MNDKARSLPLGIITSRHALYMPVANVVDTKYSTSMTAEALDDNADDDADDDDDDDEEEE